MDTSGAQKVRALRANGGLGAKRLWNRPYLRKAFHSHPRMRKEEEEEAEAEEVFKGLKRVRG